MVDSHFACYSGWTSAFVFCCRGPRRVYATLPHAYCLVCPVVAMCSISIWLGAYCELLSGSQSSDCDSLACGCQDCLPDPLCRSTFDLYHQLRWEWYPENWDGYGCSPEVNSTILLDYFATSKFTNDSSWLSSVFLWPQRALASSSSKSRGL